MIHRAGRWTRTARSIRATVLALLGAGLICFITLFIVLIRRILPAFFPGGTNLSDQTVSALNALVMLLVIAVILFLFLLYWTVMRLVLDPVAALTREIYRLTSASRLNLQNYNNYSEIKALSGSINDMMEKLSQSTMSTGVFRSIFNGMTAFLFVFEPETYNVLFLNDSLKHTFGLDDRAIGKKCWQLLEEGQNGPCSWCPVVVLARDSGAHVEWEAFNTKSGRYYRHTARLIDWSDNTRAMLQYSIDITALKETEQALIAAKESAEATSAAKTEFLARMSHEMRTPLNAIIGMTAIARQNPGDRERVENALPKIAEASTHLLQLITEVLDMANIEAGRLELEEKEFSLKKTLNHIADIMSFRIGEKKHSFSMNLDSAIPETLIADESRLSQVLTNLLSNAVKFTPPGGVIALEITQTGRSGDCSFLRFDVRDNGTGIAEGQRGKIFTLFEQGEGSFDRKHGGAGLGLAICKSIVELMGGEIWFESAPGQGSVFSFEVSLRSVQDPPPAPEDSPPEPAAPGAEFSGKTILLAEDIEINREIAIALLEDTGVAIDCACDGREALEMFAAAPERYSAILMDVHMPGIDGLEATRRIRALGTARSKSVPIIAMTANVFKEDIDHCLEAGMNGHLGKPIELDKVLETLRYWLLDVQPGAGPA